MNAAPTIKPPRDALVRADVADLPRHCADDSNDPTERWEAIAVSVTDHDQPPNTPRCDRAASRPLRSPRAASHPRQQEGEGLPKPHANEGRERVPTAAIVMANQGPGRFRVEGELLSIREIATRAGISGWAFACASAPVFAEVACALPPNRGLEAPLATRSTVSASRSGGSPSLSESVVRVRVRRRVRGSALVAGSSRLGRR